MPSQQHRPATPRTRDREQGFTLIELLVGLAIGLIIIAAALAALLASRSITGSINDLGAMQQQAAYVMRVVGAQVRPVSALPLNTAPAAELPEGGDSVLAAAVFETRRGDFNLHDTASLLDGRADGGMAVVVGYSNHSVPLLPAGTSRGLIGRDCLGASPSATLIQSRFRLDTRTHQLRCASSDAKAGAQAIANRVAEFQIRYLVQRTSASGTPTMRYRSAADIDDWAQVQAMEVCLVLYGAEFVDLPPGSAYLGCHWGTDGQFASVDVTALAGERQHRVHLVFRRVFQLRSQGLLR